MKVKMKTVIFKFAGPSCLLGLFAGCDNYAAAVAQNLAWGLPGFVRGGFNGGVEWIVGSLVNGLFLGVQ
jgi:hypothetical protein